MHNQKTILATLALTLALTAGASGGLIRSGIPWYDTEGRTVNAHGAGIIFDGGRYWLFGEYKSDTSNAFPGFGCYSSEDLSQWRFERVVLPVQADGPLGPNRVGERPKVMRCPKTGEYVMLAHADNLGYSDPYIIVATSPTVNGDYTFHGPLTYNGKPLKRWDMGTFQDTDGTGYLLIHHGPIYRLAPDYRSIEAQVANVEGMGESPAMFKSGGTYYLLTSNLTSWDRNDNYYFTAPSVSGPWTRQGLFCPEGSLTWNSQTTYVLTVPRASDTLYVYMGDRWSYPHQASAATCVWQPLTVSGTKLSIPAFREAWSLDDRPEPSATLRLKRAGQIAVSGSLTPSGGYAEIIVSAEKSGKEVCRALIDFYAKTPSAGLRYLSPRLARGTYRVEVKPTGESPVWTDKTKRRYGSTGADVNIEKIFVI